MFRVSWLGGLERRKDSCTWGVWGCLDGEGRDGFALEIVWVPVMCTLE